MIIDQSTTHLIANHINQNSIMPVFVLEQTFPPLKSEEE